MAKTVDLSQRIKSGAKVLATTDLPGVPKGTRGKVAMSNGITWKRYWVRFENGELLGHIDHDNIVIERAWDRYFAEKEAAAAAAVVSYELHLYPIKLVVLGVEGHGGKALD